MGKNIILSQVIKEIKYRYNINQKDIVNNLGLKSNTYLSDLIGGKTELSESFKDKLVSCYPIRKEFLDNGAGNIWNDGTRSDVVNIKSAQIHDDPNGTPVLDIDVTCGKEFRDLRDEKILGYVNLPQIRKDTMIVTATGESMVPKVLSGDMIVIREITNRNYFFWGQIYLVVTSEYRMLKYIRKHPTDPLNYIILHSENPNFEDVEMPIKDIYRLFLVENILSVTNL